MFKLSSFKKAQKALCTKGTAISLSLLMTVGALTTGCTKDTPSTRNGPPPQALYNRIVETIGPYAPTVYHIEEDGKEVYAYPDDDLGLTTIYKIHNNHKFNDQPFQYNVVYYEPDRDGWRNVIVNTSTFRSGELVPFRVNMEISDKTGEFNLKGAWILTDEGFAIHKFSKESEDILMVCDQVSTAVQMAQRAFKASEKDAENSDIHPGKIIHIKDENHYTIVRIADRGLMQTINVVGFFKHEAFNGGEASFLFKFSPQVITLKDAAGFMQEDYFNSHYIFKKMSLEDRQKVSEALAATLFADVQEATSTQEKPFDGNFYFYNYKQITKADRPWISDINPKASIKHQYKFVLDEMAAKYPNRKETPKESIQSKMEQTTKFLTPPTSNDGLIHVKPRKNVKIIKSLNNPVIQ